MAVVTSRTEPGAIATTPAPQLVPSASALATPIRYVDWGAILAGAVVAAAVFSLFSVFGSAIGLSLISPTEGSSLPATGLLIAGALWGIWVQVSSYMVGGYLAGRLRSRIGDAKQDEVEMRDGAHGLITWAVGTLLSALVAASLAMMAAGAAGSAATTAATAVSGNGVDMQYYADRLMRPAPNATAPADVGGDNAAIASLLSRMGASPSDDDRSYIASQIAARTGVTPEEANQRIEAATTEMAQAADQARVAAVMLAFFTAVTLLISAVGAWWAAVKGGEHRDQRIDHSKMVRWR
jgi:hypothetical protein